MTSTAEAFELLADAHDTLRHAEQNRGIGIYRVAVSLAYYATFYAARAVVAYHRESPKTHKGVRSRFHFLVVAGSDFPPQTASIVDELADDRLRADYDHAAMRGWRESEATDAIERARTFLNEVDRWFRRHHPPSPG